MFDASRRADALVAAEHDQRREAALVRALGVGQAVLERVLRGQERHDALARHVVAEIRHEMAEVVFLLRADGAVGEEHERASAREPLHGVVGVDPRIHALARRELGPRRPQFGCEHRRAGAKGGDEIHQV